MKQIIKRTILILLAAFLLTAFAACSSSAPQKAEEVPAVTEEPEKAAVKANEPGAKPEESATIPSKPSEPEPAEEPEAGTPVPEPHSEILVAFFSATGTTKGVAETIASVTGADLYEILAAEPYSDADLNYNDRSSRSTKEQNDKNARPAIGGAELSLDGYTTVYLGFPIWWGEEPRILDTFVEQYSFDGIRVIPFCTSGGSGIGRSGPNMEALAGSGTWLQGKRFGANASEKEIRTWIEGLK